MPFLITNYFMSAHFISGGLFCLILPLAQKKSPHTYKIKIQLKPSVYRPKCPNHQILLHMKINNNCALWSWPCRIAANFNPFIPAPFICVLVNAIAGREFVYYKVFRVFAPSLPFLSDWTNCTKRVSTIFSLKLNSD